MPLTDPVIRNLLEWGTSNDAVRAMLLTSTRAIPGGKTDAFSDYDVILVVRDIHPFVNDHRWIATFGEVLVAYWDPVHPDPDSGITQSGNVVQYTGTLKIDFTLWPPEILQRLATQPALPAELDAGYRILLDKDHLTATLPEPSGKGYLPTPPDEKTFLLTINDFFIGVPYVAKCLLRNDLLPAKWCLDYDMRFVYLQPMLEWWVECQGGWTIPVGINGKGLNRTLPPDIWADVESTLSGASLADNWNALFRMISLFRRTARDVAVHLGYTWPDDLDHRVTAHAHWMRENGPDLLDT
jgi:aminoglycoside 6-adenylyltransferase